MFALCSPRLLELGFVHRDRPDQAGDPSLSRGGYEVKRLRQRRARSILARASVERALLATGWRQRPISSPRLFLDPLQPLLGAGGALFIMLDRGLQLLDAIFRGASSTESLWASIMAPVAVVVRQRRACAAWPSDARPDRLDRLRRAAAACPSVQFEHCSGVSADR